ncbi:pilin [Haliangium sp.]|uniref:pilin n=1 Tax=Haliangium sp. TaxID=2663208 RepID=UPI003D1511D0
MHDHNDDSVRYLLSPQTMYGRQAGFTLIEMMIVVAIIGVLATLAVYAYQRVFNKAEVSAEVNAIFSEFKIRQEEFHAENGTYLSTAGGSESGFLPATAIPPDGTPVNLVAALSGFDGTGGAIQDNWVRLRINPPHNQVRCRYVSVAGGPSDAVGGIASGQFGMTTPLSNWYYLLAECDGDDDPSVNALYMARSDQDGLAVRNEGR